MNTYGIQILIISNCALFFGGLLVLMEIQVYISKIKIK